MKLKIYLFAGGFFLFQLLYWFGFYLGDFSFKRGVDLGMVYFVNVLISLSALFSVSAEFFMKRKGD